MNARLAVFLALVGGLVAAALVFLRPAPPTARARPLAVASIEPLSSLAREVAGPDWRVACLLPPGASPHTYEPAAAELRLLAEARLFFQVGLDLEFWAEKLVRAGGGPGLAVITVSDGLEPRRFEPRSAAPEAPPEEEGEDEHRGEFDPHLWLDPVRAQGIAEHLRRGFAAADPAHAADYAARAEILKQRLAELDREYRRRLDALPRKRVVAFHDAYGYLADRYGLEVAAVVEPAPGREPTAREMAALIALLRRGGAGVVLVEPQFSPRLAEAIARDAGARVAVIDPLGAPAAEGGGYFLMMRRNLEALEAALGAAPGAGG